MDYITLIENVVFCRGSRSGEIICVDVTIIDDTVIETEQSFTLDIDSSLAFVVGPTARVTIIDDDGMF